MEPIPLPPNPFVAAGGELVFPTFRECFFLPGDWAIYWLASRVPAIADLLGIGASDYGSTFSGILAWALWMSFAIASIVGVHTVRRLDRALTSGITYGFAELRRRARMVIVRLRHRRSERVVRKEPTFYGEEPTLSTDEQRVLELHAKVAPGFALAVSDVAAEVEMRKHVVRGLLERLQRLELIQATVGGLDGETAYTLTASGRALLRLQHARPRLA